MTKFEKIARSLGVKECRKVLLGGFEAAYAAHKAVLTDSDAVTLVRQCGVIVARNMVVSQPSVAVATSPAPVVVTATSLVNRLVDHLEVVGSDTIPGCRKALGIVAAAAASCKTTRFHIARMSVLEAFAYHGFANDRSRETAKLVNSMAAKVVYGTKSALDVVEDYLVRNDADKAKLILVAAYEHALRQKREAAELEEFLKKEEELFAAGKHPTQAITKAEEAEVVIATEVDRKAAKWAVKAMASAA